MHILITGSRGQLGNEMRMRARRYPEHLFWFVDVDELDITDRKAVNAFFALHRIDICVNCAAYTAVDKAESEEALAWKINVEGVENLALACAAHNAVLIHISTDFVFDGKASKPYLPGNPVNPLSVYGRTKAEGESRALSACAKTILIRTAWVYSSFGNNFVKTMIRLGKEKQEIRVVDDQTGSPTYAGDLADVIFRCMEKLPGLAYGIYHFTDAGTVTWCGFAQAIMRLYGLSCKVHPIATKDYPTPAKRPAYSVLDCQKTAEALQIEIPHWEDSLRHCINEIKNKSMLESIDVQKIIAITREAGEAIMDIYSTGDFEVTDKSDQSPLTKADRASNAIINERLKALYPDIPIISEENKAIAYEDRRGWEYFWLVDPLDGTKEFIKKNGEFTVNIALVRGGKPVLGVVGIPAKGTVYYAVENLGARKIDAEGNEFAISAKRSDGVSLALIGSRSHPSPEFDAYLQEMERQYTRVEFVPAGSSLKFCLVAEGVAHIYPRLGPTMEWDTAAGHAVVLEAGARVKIYGAEEDLQYNKENLLNPFFIVEPF